MSEEIIAVDAHAHVFERSLPMVAGHRYMPARDALAADHLKNLDAHGLTHGVLVQPSFLGTDNSYMLAAIDAAPKRLRGIAVVEPSIPFSELEAMAARGIVGIRLNLIGKPAPPPQQAPWQSLLAFARQHRWHVEVHADAAELPAVMKPLLASGVRIVVDHFGRPAAAQGVDDPGFRYLLSSADSGLVWVKLSGGYRIDTPSHTVTKQAAEKLLQVFTPNRLVWGSDWPHTMFEDKATYARTRSLLDEWVTDAEARHNVLGATAVELFHF
jgi:predicted TIM-barrel fold metal-dependent hydrolase